MSISSLRLNCGVAGPSTAERCGAPRLAAVASRTGAVRSAIGGSRIVLSSHVAKGMRASRRHKCRTNAAVTNTTVVHVTEATDLEGKRGACCSFAVQPAGARSCRVPAPYPRAWQKPRVPIGALGCDQRPLRLADAAGGLTHFTSIPAEYICKGPLLEKCGLTREAVRESIDEWKALGSKIASNLDLNMDAITDVDRCVALTTASCCGLCCPSCISPPVLSAPIFHL